MRKKEGKRIFKYDNIKFIMILLVVVGHFFNLFLAKSDVYKSLFLLIYSLHMPLFMFVSGQFHTNENVSKKIISYILIYFVLKITLSLETTIITGKGIRFNLFADSGLPWFMFVLAVFVALSYIFRNFDKKIIFIIFVLLSLIVGYDKSIGDFMYLARIIYFYPFYLLGEMIPKEKLLKISSNKKNVILATIIIIAIVTISFVGLNYIYPYRGLLTGRNGYWIPELENFGLIYRLLLYIITIIYGLAVFIIIPDKKIPFITENGKLTLQIYFWHWIFGKIILAMEVQNYFMDSAIGKLLWLFIGVIVTYICCLPILKFPCQTIIDSYNEDTKNSRNRFLSF